MIILCLLVIGISIFALVYTIMIGRQQKALKNDLDTDIPHEVEQHPYLRNPIFISMFVGTLLITLFIIYWAVKIS